MKLRYCTSRNLDVSKDLADILAQYQDGCGMFVERQANRFVLHAEPSQEASSYLGAECYALVKERSVQKCTDLESTHSHRSDSLLRGRRVNDIVFDLGNGLGRARSAGSFWGHYPFLLSSLGVKFEQRNLGDV